MSEEVTGKIQARADTLTADRKRRGKTVPEGLASVDDISQYHQLASHTVSGHSGNTGINLYLLTQLQILWKVSYQ